MAVEISAAETKIAASSTTKSELSWIGFVIENSALPKFAMLSKVAMPRRRFLLTIDFGIVPLETMPHEPPIEFAIRQAQIADGPLVLELIEPYVAQQKLLPRTLDEIEELLANGFVAESNGQIVGFVALEVYSKKLAEIRSLCVAESHRFRGIGQALVAACVERRRRN